MRTNAGVGISVWVLAVTASMAFGGHWLFGFRAVGMPLPNAIVSSGVAAAVMFLHVVRSFGIGARSALRRRADGEAPE